MLLFDPATLTQFTGTECYYRITKKHLLTDGTKFLAEQAKCFWLMNEIASHLVEIGTADWFIVVKTTVNNSKVLVVYEDGNGHEYVRQEIPFSDLPLNELTLYACWDGQHWVIMLPSEY